MGVLAEVDACSTVVEGEMACAVGEGKEAVTAILEQGGMAADDAKTERRWRFRGEGCGRSCRVRWTQVDRARRAVAVDQKSRRGDQVLQEGRRMHGLDVHQHSL